MPGYNLIIFLCRVTVSNSCGVEGQGGTYEKRLDSVESLELCSAEVYDPKKNIWRSRLLECAIEYRYRYRPSLF